MNTDEYREHQAIMVALDNDESAIKAAIDRVGRDAERDPSSSSLQHARSILTRALLLRRINDTLRHALTGSKV